MPTFSKARTEILLLQENVKKAEYKWGGKASYKCLMIIRHLSKKMVGANIIKNQKSVYFSSVINSHCHKSCLYLALKILILTLLSPNAQKLFLHFFVDEILTGRAHILHPSYYPFFIITPAVFSHFVPASVITEETCYSDRALPMISSHLFVFFKDIWGTIGPYIQQYWNLHSKAYKQQPDLRWCTMSDCCPVSDLFQASFSFLKFWKK